MSVTPLKGGVGIKKTLLTPCRRLGLSRKIKSTPTSSPNSPALKSTLAASPAIVLSKPLIKEEASKSQEPVKQVKNDPEKNVVEGPTHQKENKEIQKPQEVNEVKALHNEKRLVETPATHRRDKETQKRSKKINVRSKRDTKECVVVLDKNKVEKENLNEETQAKQKEKPKKAQNQKVIVHSESKTSKPLENKSINNRNENLTQDESAPRKQISEKKPDSNQTNPDRKLTKRSLSMKKTSSRDDLLSTSEISLSSHLTNEFLDECNIDSEDTLMCQSDSEELIKTVTKSSRKRCIVLSDEDEDDFVPSQGSSKSVKDESVKGNWQERIRAIQARVKQKETRLNELKQAAVYRKLHNVEELCRLTEMWERCCKESMVYLLPKLQDHVEIDMHTLMKKLDIPECIVYDNVTNSFK